MGVDGCGTKRISILNIPALVRHSQENNIDNLCLIVNWTERPIVLQRYLSVRT